MKIVIVGNSSTGLYKFRKELIKELIKKNIMVICVTAEDGYIEEVEKLGCKVRIVNMDRRGKNIFSEISLLFKYNKIIKEENPDKIITYTIKPNLYCGIINRIYKKDFYPNITGLGTAFQKEGLFRDLLCILYRISFKNAKKVFFENQYNNKIFMKKNICTIGNSVILNGAGVNLEEFSAEKLPDFRSINFIFMGRVMKEKGIEELFYAIKEIKNKYENVNFMILGSLEENYKNELKKMESEGLLKYYGMQRDVKKYIKKAHCCILPSHHEGMSNTLLECGAMGRSLIASDIPGCRESILEGQNGFLHEVKNEKNLRNRIEQYILLNDRKKEEYGIKSREHIQNTFSKKVIIKNTIEAMEVRN